MRLQKYMTLKKTKLLKQPNTEPKPFMRQGINNRIPGTSLCDEQTTQFKNGVINNFLSAIKCEILKSAVYRIQN